MKMIYQPLRKNQVEQIHAATVELLTRYGIKINLKWAVDLLVKHGATAEENQVFIPGSLIEKCLKLVPKEFVLTARTTSKSLTIGKGNPPLILPGAGGVIVRDENGVRRVSTMEDYETLLKLGHMSHVCNVANTSNTYPHVDNFKEIHPIQIAKTIMMSDKPLFSHSGYAEIVNIGYEMARLVTGVNDKYVVMGSVTSLSPMQWDATMLDTLKAFADHCQPVVIACCSLMGATSHLFLENTLITNNAEVLTGIVIAQLLCPGLPVVYGNTTGAADMRTISLSMGAPEAVTCTAAIAQLAKYYDIPFRTGGSMTDSKEIDMQAAVESALMQLMTLSCGTNVIFHALGSSECYLSVDYLKWIMDEEIYDRVLRMLEPIPDLKPEAVDCCGKIGCDSYLESDDTMDYYRERLYFPSVSDRSGFDAWEQNKLTNREVAKSVFIKKINDYCPPDDSEYVEKILREYLKTQKNIEI